MENKRKYKIFAHYVTLSQGNVTTKKEFKKVQWGDSSPSFDIRKWKNGKPLTGITLSEEEAIILYKELKRIFG